MDAVRNSRDHAEAAAAEYLTSLAEELEKFRLASVSGEFDDAVVQNIEAFIPYRNQVIDLFIALATYRDTEKMSTTIHRFFEQLIPYMDRSPDFVGTFRDCDFDNFRFIVHELFLYAIACFIRYECFDAAAYLMDNEYYVPGNAMRGLDSMTHFGVFSAHMDSLEYRKGRLQLNRLSLRSDLLAERCKGLPIEFRHLMQADFVLFVRASIHHGGQYDWWPFTLVFAARQSGAFEIFARSRSNAYFSKTKTLLGVESKEALQSFVERLKTSNSIPRWQYSSFSPAHLLGLGQIASQP